jgi:glucosamine--fructose-6-phosphate aminotransferase (isomerizing)
MCGIVGAVSKKNVVGILVEGLRRLEYRGYDSCGFALLTGQELVRARPSKRIRYVRVFALLLFWQ